jgi:Protein of unknown function (DUF3309)
MLMIVLIVVVLVLCLGGMPGWGPLYTQWGHAPISLGAVVLIILLVLLLTGRL